MGSADAAGAGRQLRPRTCGASMDLGDAPGRVSKGHEAGHGSRKPSK